MSFEKTRTFLLFLHVSIGLSRTNQKDNFVHHFLKDFILNRIIINFDKYQTII